MLRDLLGAEAERAYLHAYGRTGHRATAVDQTRHALLRAARSLEEIPPGLDLGAWVFLRLEEEAARRADCPDPAAALAGAGEAGGRERQDALQRHLDAHPHCRGLLSAYREYLVRAGDEDLRSRSGWRLVAPDLDGFLDGQFGPEDPDSAGGRAPWAPLRGWRRSRAVAFLVGAAAVILIVLLWRAWSTGGGAWSESATAPRSLPPPPAVPSGPTPTKIRAAVVEFPGDDLLFRWELVPGAERYNLLVLTARLDTLRISQFVAGAQVRIARSEISRLAPGGSYLFRVDGLEGGKVVASTGFTPFDVPGP